ncbi:MAG TPA: DUF3667 domain-containing protein [Flavitalea sp.]|nr:DUF3667 domain-containing protein [Flavitalea sp.]
MIICQNCGHEGENNYCSICGQVLQAKRISLPHLIHEVIHTFTHFERGYLFTLRELLFRPGIMQRKYLSGLRLHYQKPFPMFTISGTLCALALYLLYKNAPVLTDQYFKNYYFLVQAVLLPVYALITYLLFYSRKLYYAEALVLNIYMVGFMLLLILPINCFAFFLSTESISLIELIVLTIYNVWTYVNFFNDKPTWWIIVKSIVSILACYLLFQEVSILVMKWFM